MLEESMGRAKDGNAKGKPSTIPFKFHPRVFAALGADLVTSDVVAVIELVKNAYDAFATRVDVRFSTGKDGQPMLEIEDNGSGMSRKVIEDVWCLVATPFREDETKARRGRDARRVTGAKGLGRLSAARLGRQLEMLTKTGDGECWQVELAWADLSLAATLDDCAVQVRTGDAEELKEESGTRLRILGLNTDWREADAKTPEKKIDELEEGLSRLNPPFERVDNFQVFLTRPGRDSQPVEISRSDLLDNPIYRIEGRLSSEGRLSYRYEYRPLSGRGRKHNQELRWPTILDDLKRNPSRAERLSEKKPSCGPFAFEIRAWELDSDSVAQTVEHFGLRNRSAMRSEIRTFKGISLYRDGLLVLPKSENTRDWLGLDLRRVSKVGSRLSTSQIVGYVGISADSNPGILDTSDRERLARSPKVEEFEALLGYIVSLLENERDQDHAEAEPEATDLFRELSAESLVAATQELIQESASVSEVLPLVARFEKDLEKTRKKIERTFGHYSRLATIGLLAQQLVHEVGHNSSIIHEFLELAKEHFAAVGDATVELRRFLQLAESALASLQRLAERFRPLANRNFIRGRRTASLRETLETCLEARKQEIERRNVKVETRLRGPDTLQVDPGELYAVLINLIDNALYWLGRLPDGRDRLLRVDATLPAIKGRIQCSVHDSGLGVPKQYHDRIFWPGFTRRPNGFGMGLTVAGEIVAGHGGTLRILEDGTLGGASFAFDLPLATA